MQQNCWRNIIKFDFSSLIEFKNLIPLILGLVGIVIVIVLRIPEKNTKTTINLSKFSFLLMNYLYLDAHYFDKLVEDAGKLDQDKLYRFMIREINKTKDSQETNNKLLYLFREFNLIAYCKKIYSKSNSDRKLNLIEEFILLPIPEIYDLLLPLLTSNIPGPIKLATIKTLTFHGLTYNPVQILLCLSSLPETYNAEICQILFHIAQTHPEDFMPNPSLIDTNIQPTLSNRFISLLFQPNYKECIAGAYLIGYLRVTSASRFLAERLLTCKNKEAEISIVIALRKIVEPEILDDLYQYVMKREKIDTEVLTECLKTISSYGLIGNRILEKLVTSDKPIVKIMAKSFLSKT